MIEVNNKLVFKEKCLEALNKFQAISPSSLLCF